MAEQSQNTVLTTENITNASQAISTYINDALTILNGVKTEIDTLRAAGFIGDASEGFDTYVTTTITNIKNNFYEGDEALLPSLKKWLDSYLNQLLSSLDPDLKNQNENIYNQE